MQRPATTRVRATPLRITTTSDGRIAAALASCCAVDDAAAAVAGFRAALAAWDSETVRLALHPYLHWSGADGRVLRGRSNVLAMLAAAGVPDRPTAVELRDGQIYRWIS